MRSKLSFVLAALLLAGSQPATAESGGVAVTTDAGSVVGKFQQNSAVRAFLGIPFAAPPVGPLRWKPPQPVSPWQGADRDRLWRTMHAADALEDVGLL